MKSGLHGIFTDVNKGASWPRVALTVSKVSENSEKRVDIYSNDAIETCMEVSAIVWDSPKSSRTVAPFEFCLQKDALRIKGVEAHYGMEQSHEVERWLKASNECFDGTQGCSTGFNRTTGPIPPERAYPESVKKYGRKIEMGAYFGILLDTFMQSMGLDISEGLKAINKRVWIVSLPVDSGSGNSSATEKLMN